MAGEAVEVGSEHLHQCGDRILWAVSGIFVLGELVPGCSGLSGNRQAKADRNAVQIDAYKAAENSKYNIKNPVGPAAKAQKDGNTVQKPAPKTTYKTLSDLGAN